MTITRAHTAILATVAVAGLAACGGGYDTTQPVTHGGGPAGHVTVGTGIQYVSDHNGTSNPALDTISAGEAVTFTFAGPLTHEVRWPGRTDIPSSGRHSGGGAYAVPFTTPGTYHYDCSVHGAAMSGTIVVLQAPANDGVVTQTVADPTGDGFTSTARWDLVALTIARDDAGITATLELSADVVAPASGDPAALRGFVELDLDQDSATGHIATADEFRHDGLSTGLGVDATIDLGDAATDGSVPVLDAAGHVAGRVTPAYAGHRVSIRVPRALLGGDDGFLGAAAIVGITGAPSDMVPNVGHLTLAAAPPQ